MTRIERKARQVVRQAYFDYKLVQDKDFYHDYAVMMDMLIELFPKTTNQDALENMWDAMWRKENRD